MKNILVVLGLLLLSHPSLAIFEARVGYGLGTLSNKTYQSSDFDQLGGFNLDAIVKPPLITDFGIGLRYEILSADQANNNEVSMDRLSLLLNYRIINFFAYFGPIASYALSNTAKYKVGSATENLDEKATYSIGLEGGVNLGLLSIGAEVGKLFGKLNRTSNGSTIDMANVYVKVMAGIGF